MTGGAPAVSATDITAALRVRYPSPQWATAFEVADRTGGARRRVDCVALNCFESRGLEVHGVEIKVHRSDWLRELRNPAKGDESAQRYCDRWWVAAPRGVVQDGELPAGWGLLEFASGKLRAQVQAAPLPAAPPDRAFMAAFVRRVGGPGADELRVLLNREYLRAKREFDARVVAETRRFDKDAEEIRANSERLQALFGLNLHWLNEPEAAEIAQFVRAARAMGSEGRRAFLLTARGKVQSVLDHLDEAIAVSPAALDRRE
ncbi:hypothetical protein [Deinococcus soli (ex Cha et al. 2016)]|uniref:MmcB family DNA repair protein n=2 Tax=Deinococcus soli (ex Cha et al. 2016) TaxID=1309411 RepID=A0AAE3XDQ2_9DEIO|nr:hypothetical protein [Deinococcus soli (ex Cha et al. 2016)]MDR6218754.1 hypothetical protein [Deinococcus soli (ex Cha et al. 2016)]MDR6328551.1 hypothetical protein [Deinococcus soli (ex Cha et al. 2016)]MDR6753162.1 hypothetical protein [Deinococcus soli (ex Cha et al. 2016)]